MKLTYILYTFIITLSITQAQGQCFFDRHDTSSQSSWESCSVSNNPNPARGTSHWIMYDLGQSYDLGQMHFWNYNYPGETNKGVENIIIDYSVNATNWQGGFTHTMAEANASSFYEGEAGPQLGGITARYLLLTFDSNYGGACYGFAEMRVGIYQDPCNDVTLDIDEVPVLSGLYHAEQVLNSEGLINATSEVLFQAENEISLESGFESKEGAMFEAKISDCPN